MHILLIGYSRIAQRRVLPALQASPRVTRISVASRSAAAERRQPPFAWYADYGDALRRSGAGLAYVSLTNDGHTEWVERALAAGLHVIVDKPAFLDEQSAERAVEYARSRQLLLAEATVYAFHPQVLAMRQRLQDHETGHRRVMAAFSMPGFPPEDFRNQRELGGGAVWDLGPYAVSADRLLFDVPPERVHAEAISRAPDGLVTAFSVLFAHGEQGSLVGQFGFGTQYVNWVTAFGRGLSVTLPRAFTTTPDAAAQVVVQAGSGGQTVEIPAADSFALFLDEVCRAIADGRREPFAAALLRDAQLLARVREALGESAAGAIAMTLPAGDERAGR